MLMACWDRHVRHGCWPLVAITVATPIAIVSAALLLLFNPWWIDAAQSRAGAAGIAGMSAADLRAVTGAILADVTQGPPDFTVELVGKPVLGPDERSHMVDVYNVLHSLGLVAATTTAILMLVLIRHRREASAWRAMSRAAAVLGVLGVAAAVVVTLFFNAAFLVFHLIFFPQGNFTFDVRTQRLTRLFPAQFWADSVVAFVLLTIALAVVVFVVARHLARRMSVPTHPGA